jgi:uncharacterized protein
MLQVSALYIYPIKSLGGIALQQTELTDRGLKHDRRWLLVDDQHVFLTQRKHPAMALLQVALTDGGLSVFPKNEPSNQLVIPFINAPAEAITVTIWDDTCTGWLISKTIDDWFTAQLGTPCHLVYMPDEALRAVDKKYATNNEITSFSDGYPILLISQASLDDLNQRLPVPVPMDRFRPNIVITGSAPYAEDELTLFSINNLRFAGVKLCARCVLTTIDQATGEAGKDPLKTLAGYRTRNNKVLFGQNLLHYGTGSIRVGDFLRSYHKVVGQYNHEPDTKRNDGIIS